MGEPRRTEDVFDHARVIADAAEREAYLQTACGDDVELLARLRALLAAHEGAGEFLKTAETAGEESVSDPRAPAGSAMEDVGSCIDRYELVARIGEGGFGDVFEAQPTTPGLPSVALKLLKAGMDTRRVLARFELERRALALMEHPGIARVLDAGSTRAGRPYFVMELVDGVPLTEYADQHGLSIDARLDLFRAVCAAVQHAHQKGIIHRDLKPSNVLVITVDGVPVPKVIDFGIAKATSPDDDDRSILTREGLFLGTPQYMSPEQAGLSDVDVDTRADVYSLGVLLYELLTGTTPLDPVKLRSAGAGEMQRIIDEAETPRPSTRVAQLASAAHTAEARQRRHQLRGDLDWIVLAALEREPARRYQTVRELAEDVRRHQDDEPVSASPPSRTYRFSKFVRKNRVAVSAAALVLLTLVLGIIGTGGGLIWALANKSQLEETNVKLDRIVEFQAARISEIDPKKMGSDMRAGTLEGARRALLRSGADAAEVDEQVHRLDELLRLNFTSLAREVTKQNIFEQTREAIDAEFADQPLIQAELLQHHATALTVLRVLDIALEPQERALAIRRERLGDDHPDTLQSMQWMGSLLQLLGRTDEAAEYSQAAYEGRVRVLGPDHPRTLESLDGLASLALRQGRFDDAERGYRENFQTRRRVLGPDHAETLESSSNLAATLQMIGRLDEAESLFEELREGYGRTLGPEHAITQRMGYNLTTVLMAQGRFEEAEPIARAVCVTLRKELGDDHPDTLTALNGLGTILLSLERVDEALVELEESLASRRAVLGDYHTDTLASIATVGAALRAAERLEGAEELGRESVERARAVFPAGHWLVAAFEVEHGRTLAVMARFEEARDVLRPAYEVTAATFGARNPRTDDAAKALYEMYALWHEAVPDGGHEVEAQRWREAAGETG